MKTLLKIVGAFVACVIVLLAVLRVTGFEPKDCPGNVPPTSWTCRTPGLWLNGDVVTTPVTDWSFTDAIPTIKVQTRDRLMLPHSINTFCVAHNGELYLTSVYQPGTPAYPKGRHWNQNVARDPHVRLKIADKLYDVILVYVTDPEVRDAVIKKKALKYPKQVIAPGSYINLFHVVPSDGK